TSPYEHILKFMFCEASSICCKLSRSFGTTNLMSDLTLRYFSHDSNAEQSTAPNIVILYLFNFFIILSFTNLSERPTKTPSAEPFCMQSPGLSVRRSLPIVRPGCLGCHRDACSVYVQPDSIAGAMKP